MMAEQFTKVYLDPQTQMDEILIRSVRAYGAKRMAKDIGLSHSWLCRILRGVGGITGTKFNALMGMLKKDHEKRASQDLTIKDDTPPKQEDN